MINNIEIDMHINEKIKRTILNHQGNMNILFGALVSSWILEFINGLIFSNLDDFFDLFILWKSRTKKRNGTKITISVTIPTRIC